MEDDDDDDEVSLPHFINFVRQQAAAAGNEANVEEIVNIILAEHEEWEILSLDGPLIGDTFEDSVFDALIASQTMSSFYIPETLEGSQLLHLLGRAIPRMTSRVEMLFLGCHMSDTEADAIFAMLLQCDTLRKFGFFAIEYSDSVWRSFERFVRESTSLTHLVASKLTGNGSTELSEARFTSLCDSIASSSSLEAISISRSPVKEGDVGRATESLTRALVKSTSLTELNLTRLSDTDFSLWEPIQEALLRTAAVQTFDWTFRNDESDMWNHGLTVTRSNPWKRFLAADNVPLGLWPRILAKANIWNMETSHSSLDALYFLMREKNDVLLQNVRKRRIRKRKRFQFT